MVFEEDSIPLCPDTVVKKSVFTLKPYHLSTLFLKVVFRLWLGFLMWHWLCMQGWCVLDMGFSEIYQEM